MKKALSEGLILESYLRGEGSVNPSQKGDVRGVTIRYDEEHKSCI